MKNKKSIGLWSAASIGIGGMIGAGIFSILGVSAQIAGHTMYSRLFDYWLNHQRYQKRTKINIVYDERGINVNISSLENLGLIRKSTFLDIIHFYFYYS